MDVKLPDQSHPATVSMLADSELARSARTFRQAQVQFLLQPFLCAALMWLIGESWVKIGLMAEVLVVSMLAITELGRARDSSRRTSLVLAGLNVLFLIVFSVIIGNALLLIFAGTVFGSAAILLHGKYERRWVKPVSWFLFCGGIAASMSAVGLSKAWVEGAREAYHAGDMQLADELMCRASPVLELRGGSDAERALLLFRRAELALHAGRGEEAEKLLARCDALAGDLTLPPEDEMPGPGIQATVAHRLANRAIIDLFSSIYRWRAWGRAPGNVIDPLAGVVITPSDDIVWGW
ncbi:MAG: hypothetical protein L6Q71_08095 [Planctomycetes bacterium]|nr:hypothetical protein [Planctomycetota bacterium]